MRILVVTPFFPYATAPHAGSKFFYDVVRGLSQKHAVYLLSRITRDEYQFVEEMKQFCQGLWLHPCKNPEKRNLIGLLLIALSYGILGLKANRLIRKEQFDLVHVELVETGLFITSRRSPPMVLTAHYLLAETWRRRYVNAKGFRGRLTHYLLWKFYEMAERSIYKKFDLIFSFSDHDRNVMMNMGIHQPVEVIQPPAGSGMNFTGYDITEEPDALLFLGAMNRDTNVLAVLHFYRAILPHIRRRIPQVTFSVVGNDPPDEITRLAVQDSRVVVTGYVERVEPYYLKAAVFVSPIVIGGGIIAKNLEAMAAGRAVVTTTLGNQGIGATPGKEILVADDPVEFADKVVSLLMDKNMRDEMARQGQKFVRTRFSLDSILSTIESHYSQLTKRRPDVSR